MLQLHFINFETPDGEKVSVNLAALVAYSEVLAPSAVGEDHSKLFLAGGVEIAVTTPYAKLLERFGAQPEEPRRIAIPQPVLRRPSQ